MDKIDAIVRKSTSIIRLISSYLMILITLITVVHVFFRYVLNEPIIWSEEFSMILLIWFGFLAISSEVYLGGHMTISIAYDHFPKPLKKICDVLKNVIITAFSALMTIYVIRVASVIGTKRLPISNLPKVIIYIPVAACAIIMTIYGILLTIQVIIEYDQKEKGIK
jgi:TRAP-type C4-dicarboxylate transport system permease small subunit